MFSSNPPSSKTLRMAVALFAFATFATFVPFALADLPCTASFIHHLPGFPPFIHTLQSSQLVYNEVGAEDFVCGAGASNCTQVVVGAAESTRLHTFPVVQESTNQVQFVFIGGFGGGQVPFIARLRFTGARTSPEVAEGVAVLAGSCPEPSSSPTAFPSPLSSTTTVECAWDANVSSQGGYMIIGNFPLSSYSTTNFTIELLAVQNIVSASTMEINEESLVVSSDGTVQPFVGATMTWSMTCEDLGEDSQGDEIDSDNNSAPELWAVWAGTAVLFIAAAAGMVYASSKQARSPTPLRSNEGRNQRRKPSSETPLDMKSTTSSVLTRQHMRG